MSTAALLAPEELLAGREAVFEVEIPGEVLRPAAERGEDAVPGGRVRLRPLTVGDVQLIAKAAKDDGVLTSVLMLQRSLVEPELSRAEIAALHGGLVAYLVERINRISGLTSTEDELRALAESPLVQAFFILAREFHWTPEQLRAMTLGEVLGYLELVQRGGEPG